MASVSISHMILFIGSVVVAASVVGVFTSQVDQISASIDVHGADVNEQIRTDIEIISDTGDDVYNRDGNGNITLLVKNTGSRELPDNNELIDIIVNGSFRPPEYITVTVVDGDEWDPKNVAKIEISNPQLASNADHRVKVIISGDSEVLRFNT